MTERLIMLSLREMTGTFSVSAGLIIFLVTIVITLYLTMRTLPMSPIIGLSEVGPTTGAIWPGLAMNNGVPDANTIHCLQEE